MATGVNIFINKILDDLFPPLSTPNHISSPIVHHSVDATVLSDVAGGINLELQFCQSVMCQLYATDTPFIELGQVLPNRVNARLFFGVDKAWACSEKEREKEELETYKVVELPIVSQRDESGGQCKYMSKKQLVKRHLETTHLALQTIRMRCLRQRFSPEKFSRHSHARTHWVPRHTHAGIIVGCGSRIQHVDTDTWSTSDQYVP
ncbi:hypothetical protein P692DRAFT_201853759 [Suillus brevipes Sb2]|nr:hypothetical protein P692DRAFT_201853759 [Suillus brevipes Sb2]